MKAWRVAQAIYMPQTLAYLPDENGSPASDDTEQLNDSKPETWLLFLPSAVPKDDRSLCYKGVVETERILRLAQLQDNLVDLRRFRRALRNLRLYFKTNTAGEGQKTQTKSRTIETGVSDRIKRAVRRYRVAYRALLELDAAGDWTGEYRELKDEDNRGPLKEAGERGTGDGRYAPSWIWTAPSSMALPGEGSAAEQQEVNETARHEWMTCRARADRWAEEDKLLQEEMRRVVVYLEWKSRLWSDKVGIRAGSCSPDIQRGVDAYARKQANIYHEIAASFAGQWVPYLDACHFDTRWVTEIPWLSRALSHQTELPKQPTAIPANDSRVPPAIGSSPGTGGPEMGQKYSVEDGGRKGEDNPGKRSDDDEEDSDDEGRDFDDEDKGDEDGGSDDEDGGSDDEFGFEYDDDYMS
jgi:hypothetical protein